MASNPRYEDSPDVAPCRPGSAAPHWEAYERLVARLMADQWPTEYCVTPNARIVGRITGRKRQVDVLIDLRHDWDNSRRLVVDAKRRGRKIDVTDVEAFRGLMGDVGATHGYLVCPHGHTKAAQRRAQTAVSIRLLPLDRLDDFDPSTWPQCPEFTLQRWARVLGWIYFSTP